MGDGEGDHHPQQLHQLGLRVRHKLDDYNKPTFGFEAACDTSDVLGTYSFAELS